MVYLLLADGFEEIEAVTPIDILRRGGVSVQTAALEGRTVMGSHGMALTADIGLDEIDPGQMEMLILPGGPGHENLDKSAKVQALIEAAWEDQDCYLAAICAAHSILGKKNYYAGKKATCYPGYETYLNGAELAEDLAVADGRLVTGKGPGAAADFGFMLLKLLKGETVAQQVKRAMQY